MEILHGAMEILHGAMEILLVFCPQVIHILFASTFIVPTTFL